VRAAIASMIALNKTASSVMRRFAVHACSDVTGFGLLGHAYEMASGSNVTIVLQADSMPLLPGAAKLAAGGHLTGGCKRNKTYLADKVAISPSVAPDQVEVAFDPQTSGGLLIALAQKDSARLIKALRASGVATATIVGTATKSRKAAVELV
jgi:selenide,water dikinase